MNLYAMPDEGKLYNFYRGLDLNSTFVTSPDDRLTWSDPVHLVKNQVNGRQHSYAR